MTKRPTAATFLALALAFAGLGPAVAQTPDPDNWPAVLREARGQTVYFHAWGGSQRVNDYIAWAGGVAKDRFGVSVVHVKVTDTADVVSRILAEKAAGRREGGAVDLVWINGENFVALKDAGMLLDRPWATSIASRGREVVNSSKSVQS